MPCYEVRTISVEFKAQNSQLLGAAIKDAGLVQTFGGEGKLSLNNGAIVLDLEAGRAQVRAGWQDKLNELKRAYSKEAVKAACKRVQWAAKFEGQKATVTKLKW